MIRPKRITKRQLQAVETRKRLFDTAAELFKEYGYDSVSIDEIVEQAGTSKGAFYAHFKSKDQIILEQFNEIDDHYIAAYQKIKRQRKAKNQLLALVAAQQEYVMEKLGVSFMKTVYSSHIVKNDNQKPLADESRALYNIVREIIEYGQKTGEFRNDADPMELTRVITRGMRGTIYDWCVRNGEFNLKKEGRNYFQYIIDGISAGNYSKDYK